MAADPAGGTDPLGPADPQEAVRAELDRLAGAVPVGDDGALDVSRLERLSTAVLTRVLRRWLLSRGVTSPTYAHLTAVAPNHEFYSMGR